MTTRLFCFAALASAAMALGGCASGHGGASSPAAGSPKPAAGPNSAARTAIQDLVSSYQANDSEGFLRLFDDQNVSGFQSYAEGIRDFLRDNKEINLELIFDSAVEDRGLVAATAHWNKSLVTKAGQQALSKGSCELVFRRQANGRLLLSAIHGESPF